MGKKDKKEPGRKEGKGSTMVPIGFTSTMTGPQAPAHVLTPADPLEPVGSLASASQRAGTVHASLPGAVPPLAAVASPAAGPVIDHAAVHDTQRRLVDLAVEKETLSVRLEDATRQRVILEEKVAELNAAMADLRSQRAGSDSERTALATERDKLLAENQQLQDEILRLPAELEAVTKSRAFRIMKAAPILAIRKPLSTLLIVGAMGALANLWDFSNVARTLYLVVGGIVLLVSAIQFLARND